MKIKIEYLELEKQSKEELLKLLQKQKLLLINAKLTQKSLGFSPEAAKGNQPTLQKEIKKNIARINKVLKLK